MGTKVDDGCTTIKRLHIENTDSDKGLVVWLYQLINDHQMKDLGSWGFQCLTLVMGVWRRKRIQVTELFTVGIDECVTTCDLRIRRETD